ncbi:MAG: HAMP domain-containing protein [Desulfuromusa sp.]|nr:HAMP domain-containing protein [Desulfuromusa sp.]
MFDNLIARAIIPVTIAVTGFVIFGCLLLYSFIKADMTADAVRYADSLVETVVKSTHYSMMEDDRDALRNIVANVDSLDSVERVRIYDQTGHPKFSDLEGITEPGSVAAKVDTWAKTFMQSGYPGRENIQQRVDHENGYIAVTVPILNEPKCFTAACHVHSEGEQTLGFLSIGITSTQLEKTLAVLRYRMIIFSIMVLFLTIGGVTALLRMNLFLPILRLTYNAEQAAQGVAEYDLPKSDHKLGKLNKDFRLLVKQRDQALEDLKAMGNLDRNVDDGSR